MKMKGFISGFVMLALLLSVFAIPFGAMASWEDPSSDLTFTAFDRSDKEEIEGVAWSVASVFTGELKDSGETDENGEGFTSALDHGNYILNLEKDGYKYRNVLVEYKDGSFEVDGRTNILLGMTPFTESVLKVNVTGVTDGANVAVNAHYSEDDDRTGVSVTETAVSTGEYVTVNLTLHKDEVYTLEVSAEESGVNYVKNVTTVDMSKVDQNDVKEMDVNVETGNKVTGYADKTAAMEVTYVSTNTSMEADERIVRATVENRKFTANLADDEYQLIVVAEGYRSVVGKINVANDLTIEDGDDGHVSEFEGLLDVSLVAKDKQGVNYMIDFGEDMSTVNYTVTKDLDRGFSMGVIDYDHLPLRMQVDLIYGDGDGNVSEAEAGLFISDLMNKTNAFPSVTDNLIAIEGVTYESQDNLSISADGLVGDVDSNASFYMNITDDYVATDQIAAVEYDAAAKLSYDTVEFDYSYTFAFPQNYEIDRFKELESAYLSIERDDAGVFTFDPEQDDSAPMTKNFEVTTSAKPSAVGSIAPSDVAYAEEEDGVLQHYIVGEGKEVEFDASESVDANGNPLETYEWDFGDGNSDSGETVNHTYADSGENTVTLTVSNHYNESSSIEFEVMVDGIAPEAEIGVATSAPKAGISVSFTGHNSSDDLLETGDGLGVIAKWAWDFGDGNSVNKTTDNGNVTHTYEADDTYTVTMTAYDVAGNSHETTEDVTVIRAEAPTFSVDLPDEMPLFTEGSDSSFEVTVKNTGDWDASDVMLNLYVREDDEWRMVSGSETELGDLAEGEETTVNMTWTPSDPGSFRLKVEASTFYEGTDVTGENYRTVDVEEAAWRTIAVFAAVIGVIILVIALVYFRNRLPGAKKLDLKGGKDHMAPSKVERPSDDFDDFEETRRKSQGPSRPSSGKGGKRRR